MELSDRLANVGVEGRESGTPDFDDALVYDDEPVYSLELNLDMRLI